MVALHSSVYTCVAILAAVDHLSKNVNLRTEGLALMTKDIHVTNNRSQKMVGTLINLSLIQLKMSGLGCKFELESDAISEEFP